MNLSLHHKKIFNNAKLTIRYGIVPTVCNLQLYHLEYNKSKKCIQNNSFRLYIRLL